MWKQLSDWIHRVSSSRITLFALIIFLLFIALVLPGQASKAEANIGSASSPDMSFYYTAGDLYKMAEAYGEEGRRAYVRARFTFDVVWPLVYTLFLCTGISWIYLRAFASGSLWQLANLIPVFAASCDYLENISTSLVMIRYPNPTAVVDVLAAAFTIMKWILLSGSFILLLLGVVMGLWQLARKRRKE
jgi:ABC-type dipeptide/oligopeptide/nickel transport system permease component